MLRSWLTLFAFVLAVVCGLPASPAAGQTPVNSYPAVPLGGLAGAGGINDTGVVAGSMGHAALWQNGSVIDLGGLPYESMSWACGINNFGQAVGFSFFSGFYYADTFHALLWQNGAVIDLGTLGGYESSANAINDAGQVVGWSRGEGNLPRAFLWDSATGMHDLGTLGGQQSFAYAINRAGQVVGEAQAADGNYYPFRWTPNVPNGTTGTMAALGGLSGVARGINDSGEVVGTANGQPVRWDSSGVAHSLAVLSGYDSGSAYAINNAGEIAGACSYTVWEDGPIWYDDNGNVIGGGGGLNTYWTAVVWDSAGAIRDLNALTQGTSYLEHAFAINESGRVVAGLPSATAYYLLTPSPAPLPPLNLAAYAGITQVDLSWPASYGASGYSLYRSRTSGGPYSLVATLSSTTYTDATVTNGTTYFYVVTATNTVAESGPSNEVTATPQVTPSPWLNASGGDAKVILAWGASPHAGSYRVKRATVTGGPYTTIATGVITTRFEDSSVVNATRYYYVVTVVNGPYESPNSPEASAMPTRPPTAPTGLTASASKGKVTLKWTQSTSAGVVLNRIFRCTTSGGTYMQIAEIPVGRSYSDTSVTSGTTYYYKVKAVNLNGQESPYSNTASAKPR